MKNKIILVGFMGCGKSSIGRILAEKMHYSFQDTDDWIEAFRGKKITSIFQTEGEEAFREMETQCLEHFCKEQGAFVLATGGGLPEGGSIPTFSRERGEKNRRLLQQIGKVFYLKTTAQEIYGRLRGDTTRPLLQVKKPMQEIQSLMKRREQYYEQCAHEIIDTTGKTPEEIAEEIILRYRKGEQE